MKYMNKLTWSLILCTGLFTACSDDDEPVGPGEIAVDKTEIAVGPEGGSELIEVTTPDSWVAQVAAPWVMVSPANGNGSMESKVNIDATLEYQSRSTDLLYRTTSGKSQTVTITQLGYGKQIYLKEDVVEVESAADYDKRLVDFTITANVECIIDKVEYEFETNGVELTEAEMAEAEKEKTGWLMRRIGKNEIKLEDLKETVVTNQKDLGIVLDEGSRPRTVKLNCRWNMNIVPWVRVAKIYLAAKNPEDQLVNDKGENIDHVILTVKQKAAMKIEDNRAGDSLAIVLINEKVRSMYPIETSENMRNWTGVTLWEETDDDVPEGAVGRVRSVAFSMVNIADGDVLPREVRYLKYLESFSIASNDNSQIRNVKMCDELCNLEYLKSLTVKAYGLQELPNNFKNLKNLEVLDLSFNCFTSLDKLTQTINKTNFPKMRKLHLYGQRRNDVITDLEASSKDNYQYNGYPLGLHFKMHGSGPDDPKETNAFLQLLTWEELEALELSYCFMEGTLPTDKQMETALKAANKPLHYTEADFSVDKKDYLTKLVGDTCRWLLDEKEVTRKNADGTPIEGATVKGNEVLRVLPRARAFSLNLNFFTGELPNWILFHPHFVEWRPTALIFNQQEKGKNSDGEPVGFSNIDADNYNFSYYYGAKPNDKDAAYHMYYSLYVASTGDQEEETISIPYRR